MNPPPPLFEPAPQPADEAQRLQALRDADILDSPPEAVFDDLTALAAQIIGVPIALVSLIDRDRQWFKSHHGLDLAQTPRDWAFCAHAILGDALFEIPDATQDSRFAGNPLVVGDTQIRFYAAVPLQTQGGHRLGTLCVLDRAARRLDAQQRDALTRLSRLAANAIAMRSAARRLRQTQQQVRRLADFNALLAHVNQAAASAQDEGVLLDSVCQLAVRYAHVRIAYVARPDAGGRFQFLARAGQTRFLDEIVISARADAPEGQGFAGRAWREGRAFYADAFTQAPELGAWHEPAVRYGLQAAATVPVERDGAVWAVLSVLDERALGFDADLRTLMEELARTVSRGLDRIDLLHRERDAAAMQAVLLDASLAAIASVREHRLVRVNEHFVQLLGWAHADDLLGTPIREIYADAAEYERMADRCEQLHEGRPLRGEVVRLRRQGGAIVLCDLSIGVVPEASARTLVWTLVDITERQQLHVRLERSLAYQRSLMDKNAAGIFTMDTEGIIQDVNPALCEIFGYAREDLVGFSTARLHGGQSAYEQFRNVAEQAALNNLSLKQEHSFQHAGGAPMTCQIMGVPIELPDGAAGVLWSVIDITALHAARETIVYQALHDVLTELPNRRALEQTLPRALARAERNGFMLAVGMLDLDDFKPINDTHGHEAGDRLLRQLATRLRSCMRGSDTVARLGGDEFVLVMEDLDDVHCAQQIETILQRVHHTVESPFEVGPGVVAKIGMSLGLALYPQDGTTSDALLRQADVSLYEVKAHKLTRPRWWQLGTGQTVMADSGAVLEPFEAQAQALLTTVAAHLDGAIDAFVRKLVDEFDSDATMQSIVGRLDAARMQALARHQAEHLRKLLSSGGSHDEALERARRLGRVHALVGVPPVLLTHATGLFRQVMAEHLRRAPIMARTRYQLTQVAEARLQADFQVQMQAHDRTVGAYYAVLDGAIPKHGTLWQDALTELLAPIGALPGMRACLAMRPDSHGQFQVEAGAGERALALTNDLHAPAYQVRQDDDVPAGRGLVGRAWRLGTIQSTPQYEHDDRLRLWQAIIAGHRIQSVAAIPVMNAQDKPAFILVLFGAYPNQFGSRWMRQFNRSLQQRAAQFWRACRVSPTAMVLPHDVAQDYRNRLFRGGLCVFMQPVVDLRSAAVPRVEALARLRLDPHVVVPPAVFLPLLRDSELDRLFRLVLEQSLVCLSMWQAQGLQLDVAVNLAPSTLLNPHCPQWVREALSEHGIEPRRLTLELLETQELDSAQQGQAMASLAELGVKLAMDDLGSGYSSLKRLSELPFDTIKVDQSLTLNLRKSPLLTFSLIRTLIKMANDLERQVIVEGVEDAGALEAIVILGATHAQGYGLARPMPAQDVAHWVRTFALPIAHGEIHTYLGALAHHWVYVHAKSGAPTPLGACPVTRFLAERGLGDSQAAQWHAQVHARHDPCESSQHFVAWLLEAVLQEEMT